MTTYAEKVNIGDPGWTGATAIANLLSAVITDKMGGEVDLIPGNNTAIYGAIDRSKSEKLKFIQIFGLPNQQAYTNDLVPKGTLETKLIKATKAIKVTASLKRLLQKWILHLFLT